jgi:MFS family permease
MLIPQNSGLIQQMFSGDERGRAFGILGATVGVATAAGPVIGGLILAAASGPDAWRWVFYVNLPLGVVALVLAARLVPDNPGDGWRAGSLDWLGSLLLGGGVLSLLVPLVEADSGSFSRLAWLLALAPILLGTFGWWEVRTVRRGRLPLLDPGLARTAGYPAGTAIGLTYFIGFTGIWLVLALYFQDGLGYTPLRSGLSVTPFALGVVFSAVIAGRLVSRLGRWLTVFGLTATLAGLLATALVLLHVTGDAVTWAVAGPLLVAGLGGGMVTSPNITLSLENVPVRMAGAAGGALQTAQRIGGAIGAAVLVTIFYHVLASMGHDYSTAISAAVIGAAGFMLLALLMAITELVRLRMQGGPRFPVEAPPEPGLRAL